MSTGLTIAPTVKRYAMYEEQGVSGEGGVKWAKTT
jgi:hypothetical protein